MTPKQKCDELIEKFKIAQFEMGEMQLSMKLAKQCALIFCNEALAYADQNWNEENWSKDQSAYYDFWTEVTKEIEKL